VCLCRCLCSFAFDVIQSPVHGPKDASSLLLPPHQPPNATLSTCNGGSAKRLDPAAFDFVLGASRSPLDNF
jgi:hypothetical protein